MPFPKFFQKNNPANELDPKTSNLLGGFWHKKSHVSIDVYDEGKSTPSNSHSRSNADIEKEEDSNIVKGSSESLFTDEPEKRLQEGMRRAKVIKDTVVKDMPQKAKEHRSTHARSNIMSAAFGIEREEESNLAKGSSESLYTDEPEKRLQEGMRRAKVIKDTVVKDMPQKAKEHRSTHARSSIMSAAFGIEREEESNLVKGSSESLYTDEPEKRLQEGMRRAKVIKDTVVKDMPQKAKEHRSTHARSNIMSAAFGIEREEESDLVKGSSESLYTDEPEKRLQEGMRRAKVIKDTVVKDMPQKAKEHRSTHARSNIMSAAFGIEIEEESNLVKGSSESLYTDEPEKRLQEGMRRAKVIKDTVVKDMPQKAKEHRSTHARSNIMSAAFGIEIEEESNLVKGSSESLYTDEPEKRLQEGMRRAKVIKDTVVKDMPQKAKERRSSHMRSNIMSATFGIVKSDIIHGSSSSILSEDLEKRMGDGMRRAEQQRSDLPGKEKSRVKQPKRGILAASIGVKKPGAESRASIISSGSSVGIASEAASRKSSLINLQTFVPKSRRASLAI